MATYVTLLTSVNRRRAEGPATGRALSFPVPGRGTPRATPGDASRRSPAPWTTVVQARCAGLGHGHERVRGRNEPGRADHGVAEVAGNAGGRSNQLADERTGDHLIQLVRPERTAWITG